MVGAGLWRFMMGLWSVGDGRVGVNPYERRLFVCWV